MADPAAALATQVRNIEARTGKTMAQLGEMIRASGLAKHGEIVAWLKQTLSLGHGDANMVAHVARAPAPASDAADPLDQIYSGGKAALRPLHDRVMQAVEAFGPFEVAPKKGYVSLRRKKQFAMLGPATKDQMELGLNARDLPPHERLKAQPAGGMCQYKVRFGKVGEVDKNLLGWIRAAYDAAG